MIETDNIGFRCRSCYSERGSIVLDLGVQPLANNLLNESDLNSKEPKFPLRLAVCNNCHLMQIVDLVPPVKLFTEYFYFSSFSDTMVEHARRAAERYIKEFNLTDKSFVIEIASNDGYLLRNFVAAKIPCLGIEPAKNVADVAIRQGIPTVVEFFGEPYARKLVDEGRQADLILANNVFAHVPEINGFVEGLKIALKPNGSAILEFPYGIEMIEKNEFDTIYHEHVFYFTITALLPLFASHGLQIYEVERIPIHGGSLRLFVGHPRDHTIGDSVKTLLEEEEQKGIKSIDFYLHFAERVKRLKDELVSLIYDLKSKNKSIAAYGASAKGSTLLNYTGLNNSFIDFIADRSVYKQGKLSPGAHIPIVSPDWLIKRQPDYTLLLTWNFADEILAQQNEYRRRGGKFIIPIPEVKIV
jgi:SAM-dependent methyltransferase